MGREFFSPQPLFMSKVRLTYEQIIEIHPEFKGIVTQESWDFMKDSDERTNMALYKKTVSGWVKTRL